MALSFDDPFGSSVDHAGEIANAVNAMAHAEGGAHQADIAIVAHSMGGLALRWYLAHDPHPRVRTAVSIASPHAGTWVAWLGWGAGAREMRPNSAFLKQLSGFRIPASVRFVCLRAPMDTRVLPSSSAWLSGAECGMLPARGHKRVLAQKSVCHRVAALLVSDNQGITSAGDSITNRSTQ